MESRETMVWREGYGVVPKSEAARIDAARAEHNSGKKSEALNVRTPGRGSWVFRDGAMVNKADVRAVDAQKKTVNRSDLPAPMVMRDLAEYRNTIDGTPIDGRAQHREFLKKHNMIEVGNEMQPEMRKGPKEGEIKAEIKETIEQLEQNYVDPDLGPIGALSDADFDEIAVPDDIQSGDIIRDNIAPDGSTIEVEAV